MKLERETSASNACPDLRWVQARGEKSDVRSEAVLETFIWRFTANPSATSESLVALLKPVKTDVSPIARQGLIVRSSWGARSNHALYPLPLQAQGIDIFEFEKKSYIYIYI